MHLSYCTNVHPAEDLAGVLDQLDRYSGPIREAAGLPVLGVGLWLPSAVAAQLAASSEDRDLLRKKLFDNGLELRTINAFPWAAFHADVVKLSVYSPDWTEPARLTYTLDCAQILADLLPPGAAGSISTLPLGWREGWTADHNRLATEAMAALSARLRQLRDRTGRTIRVDIEPEPGCILDNVADVVAWLAPRLGAIDPEFVGICLDTCHLAVSFADPEQTVRQISSAGIRIVKVQASSALEVPHPDRADNRAAIAEFAEQRYLHQVRELSPNGQILGVDDLPEALTELPGAGPWRVHFHVPLHHQPAAPLRATSEVLSRAVAAVRDTPLGSHTHLDIETYTWSVLPEGANPADLVDGIAAELRWATTELLHTTPASALGAI